MKWINRELGIVIAVALVISAIALTSALTLNPKVVIGASPNITFTSSTVSATAVDLSGSGIEWVKIYENGALVKECSTSTCVFVAVHTTPGIRTYYAVTSDRGDREATSSTITVNFQNSAPVLNPIGNKIVTEGVLLQFIISGYDINNDTLTYSVSGLPFGATFNATTRAFRWTPNYTQAGVYSLTFSVSDGILSDSETITITVNNGNNPNNHAPVLNPIGTMVVNAGNLLQFTISASDSDSDPLIYSASGVPSGAVFNAGTRTFSWNTAISDIGTYYVNFSVNDGFLGDSEIVQINVVNGSAETIAPVWEDLKEIPVNGSAYSSAQNYSFIIDWTDNVAVSDVWINFDSVITHLPVSLTDNYVFNVPGLAAGIYSYAWYAQDSSGNVNTTGFRDYVVSKAVPALTINRLPSGSVANGTQTNITGFGCPNQLTCTLYRNGVNVSNSDIATLSAGTYNYVYNTTGNENYTSGSVSATLTVGSGGSVDGGDGGNGGGNTHVIGDEDLRKGYYIYMDIGDRLKFNFCGAPYYIKLTDIDSSDDEAYFKLTPGEETFILGEGDKEELDLDENKVNDILFRVESIGANRVKIFIKRISDICSITLPQNVTSSADELEKLQPKGQKSTLTYAVIFLMAGIFFAALALLIYFLGRMRKK